MGQFTMKIKRKPQQCLRIRFVVIVIIATVAVHTHAADPDTTMTLGQSMVTAEDCRSTDRIFDVSLSPDERHVLVSDWRPSLEPFFLTRVWSLETGEVIHDLDVSSLTKPRESSKEAIFSPDGRYIITQVDGGAWVWDAETGAPLRGLMGNVSVSSDDPILRFLHDGQEILIAGNSGVDVWDVESGVRLYSFPALGYQQSLDQSADVTADGRYLLSYISDVIGKPFSANLIEIATGRIVLTMDDVTRAILSPTSPVAVTRSVLHGMQLWNLETGKVEHDLYELVNVYDWEFSPDGRYFAMLVSKGFLLWDVETGELLQHHDYGGVAPFGFLLDREHVVIPFGSYENTEANPIEIWNIRDGTRAARTDLTRLDSEDSVSDFEFTADSRHVVIATYAGGVQLWDIWDGRLIRQFC